MGLEERFNPRERLIMTQIPKIGILPSGAAQSANVSGLRILIPTHQRAVAGLRGGFNRMSDHVQTRRKKPV